MALGEGTRECEECDEKILQRVRDDDGAEVSFEVAHDEAVDDAEHGQRDDRCKSFIGMQRTEEHSGDEDGGDRTLCPCAELL